MGMLEQTFAEQIQRKNKIANQHILVYSCFLKKGKDSLRERKKVEESEDPLSSPCHCNFFEQSVFYHHHVTRSGVYYGPGYPKSSGISSN